MSAIVAPWGPVGRPKVHLQSKGSRLPPIAAQRRVSAGELSPVRMDGLLGAGEPLAPVLCGELALC